MLRDSSEPGERRRLAVGHCRERRVIHLTEAAREKLRQIVGGRGEIRIHAEREGGGPARCGLLIDEQRPGDRVLEIDGLRILIDPHSLAHLDGATMDFHRGSDGGEFRLRAASSDPDP